MRPTATDIALCVISQCVSAAKTSEPIKLPLETGSLVGTQGTMHYSGGAEWCHMANANERPVNWRDAALRQMTATTCLDFAITTHNLVFSASTLLIWRQEEHPACKNWVMGWWCGYLSVARCRQFAYGPVDATAIPKPHLLFSHLNPDWFYLSGTTLPRLSWKKGS